MKQFLLLRRLLVFALVVLLMNSCKSEEEKPDDDEELVISPGDNGLFSDPTSWKATGYTPFSASKPVFEWLIYNDGPTRYRKLQNETLKLVIDREGRPFTSNTSFPIIYAEFNLIKSQDVYYPFDPKWAGSVYIGKVKFVKNLIAEEYEAMNQGPYPKNKQLKSGVMTAEIKLVLHGTLDLGSSTNFSG